MATPAELEIIFLHELVIKSSLAVLSCLSLDDSFFSVTVKLTGGCVTRPDAEDHRGDALLLSEELLEDVDLGPLSARRLLRQLGSQGEGVRRSSSRRR